MPVIRRRGRPRRFGHCNFETKEPIALETYLTLTDDPLAGPRVNKGVKQ
jgi:hypothetical protein